MSESTSRSGASAFLLALVVVAGAGGLIWAISGDDNRDPPTHDNASGVDEGSMQAGDYAFAMPELSVPTEELNAVWDGERASMASEMDLTTQRLLSEYASLNVVSGLTAHHTFDGNMTEIESSFREAVRNTITANGVDGYRYASWYAHARFRTSLVAMLERISTQGLTWDDALSDPTDPLTHEYLEACGDFAQVGLATGLVTDDGELTMPPELVTVLFRVRWFSFVRETYPLEELMSGPELRFYTDWRIRQATNLPAARRLQLLDQYESRFGAFPDDDGVQVRAALLAELGRQEEAAELLGSSE